GFGCRWREDHARWRRDDEVGDTRAGWQIAQHLARRRRLQQGGPDGPRHRLFEQRSSLLPHRPVLPVGLPLRCTGVPETRESDGSTMTASVGCKPETISTLLP